MANPRSVSRAVADAVRGGRYLLRGWQLWKREPRVMAVGLIPGAVVLVGFVALATAAVWVSGSVGDAVAGAAFDQGSTWHGIAKVVVTIAFIAGSVALLIYTFAAVTLTVGQPFFERISRAVDNPAVSGGPDESWWRGLWRGVTEWARILAITLPIGALGFVIGWIPVVGTAVQWALTLVVGGWALVLELTAYPYARRGTVALKERRRTVAQHRPLMMGFGVATFAAFLIPLGAVLFMPAAMAGATLMVRDLDELGARPEQEHPLLPQ